MKSYNVKYSIGQDVYILNNKSVYKSKIDKIRITEQTPRVSVLNGTPNQTADAKDGVVIEYLVQTKVESFGDSGGQMIGFDWYNQRDVFSEREELISAIQ